MLVSCCCIDVSVFVLWLLVRFVHSCDFGSVAFPLNYTLAVVLYLRVLAIIGESVSIDEFKLHFGFGSVKIGMGSVP